MMNNYEAGVVIQKDKDQELWDQCYAQLTLIRDDSKIVKKISEKKILENFDE